MEDCKRLDIPFCKNPKANKMSKNGKRILHIVPYSNLYPPTNGGQLRCFHIGTELSKHFEVVLLTLQPRDTFPDRIKSQIQILNPKKKVKYRSFLDRIKNAVKFRWIMRSMTQSADATVLNFYGLIKDLKREGDVFDFVIMEHLSSMKLGKVIKSTFPKAIRIVDQHNVDHLLHKQNHNPMNRKESKTYKDLFQLESNLSSFADLFFACSDYDVEILQSLNNNKIKGFVIPNGTTDNFSTLPRDFSDKSLLFCGSLDYPPNKSGLIWFYHNIWLDLVDAVPDVKFTIIGRNGDDAEYDELKSHANINFIGTVGKVDPYYQNSNIAIVPLHEGSGTRLKILEAMKFGNPVLSTTVGAQGINYTDQVDIMIADDAASFLDLLKKVFLTPDISRLSNMSESALQLVRNNYTWEIIGQKMLTYLKEINQQN